jgi:hypothetical protein
VGNRQGIGGIDGTVQSVAIEGQISELKTMGRLVLIIHHEKTQSIKAWAKEFGVPYSVFRWRIAKGWSIERASRRYSTHRMKNTKEYKAWSSMKQRCNQAHRPNYKHYGGRGIKVCEEWLCSFETFYRDVGPAPSSNYELDRIDNNKGYEPKNVQWTTHKRNCWNRRNTVLITYKGKTQPLKQWCIELSLRRRTVDRRLRSGLTAKEIFDRRIGYVQG